GRAAAASRTLPGTARRRPVRSRYLAAMTRWAGLLLSLLGVCAAANSPRPLDQYTLESWDTSDGLPHSTVQSIAQTRDGYLWLGTWEGLARYNGLEMRVFDRTNTPALGDSGIRVLLAARDGALWIGTAR